MKERLQAALDLRYKNNEKSNEMLVELVKKFPTDSVINYQCAWSFDLLSNEVAAIPLYEKAIMLGLKADALEDALIGLGSSYRSIGKYDKALLTFETAIEKFPTNLAFQTFKSMTLYNLNDSKQAVEELLKILVKSTNDEHIKKYSKALLNYAADLNKIG